MSSSIQPIRQKETFEMEGVVSQSLSNGLFRVHLENGFDIIATLSGNIRRKHIRILIGDRVKLQMSAYDLKKGRIIFRYREKGQSLPSQ